MCVVLRCGLRCRAEQVDEVCAFGLVELEYVGNAVDDALGDAGGSPPSPPDSSVVTEDVLANNPKPGSRDAPRIRLRTGCTRRLGAGGERRGDEPFAPDVVADASNTFMIPCADFTLNLLGCAATQQSKRTRERGRTVS